MLVDTTLPTFLKDTVMESFIKCIVSVTVFVGIWTPATLLAQSVDERSQYQHIKTESIGADLSIVYFGKGGVLTTSFGADWAPKCIYRPSFISSTTRTKVEAAVKKKGLLGTSGSWNQEQAVIKLTEKSPKIVELLDLLSINCLHYWLGGQTLSSYLRANAVIMRSISRL